MITILIRIYNPPDIVQHFQNLPRLTFYTKVESWSHSQWSLWLSKTSFISHITPPTNYQYYIVYPLVLIIVIVPLPCVWILVRATTTFPERPGPWPETHGREAKSPTGCRTGRDGAIKILSLISFRVTSFSRPPGFTNPNGYTSFVISLLLLLLPQLDEDGSVGDFSRTEILPEETEVSGDS